MIKRICFILSVPALILFSYSGYAFEPSENGAGVRWVSASAESWSGSFQTNGSGANAHLAGAYDASVDTTNGDGVLAMIGLLDGIRTLLGLPWRSY